MNTGIYEKNRKRQFIKNADCDEARGFLQIIVERDNIAKEFFKGFAKVLVGSLKEDAIHYPYLFHQTLESMIANAIVKGDANYGIRFIEEYIRFIGRLPAEKILPDEFMKKLGIPHNHIIEPVSCLLSAPLDCIPCNILVDGQSWFVIDNEWTQNFPMPVDFLIYRAIYSLVINLQSVIQSNVSREKPVALFCGYGLNRVYIPYNWLEVMNSSEIQIDRFHLWERYFKDDILIGKNRGRLRLKRKPKRKHNITPIYIEFISIVINNSDKYIRFAEVMRKKIKIIYTRLHNLHQNVFIK